jgi:hypothetical protein
VHCCSSAQLRTFQVNVHQSAPVEKSYIEIDLDNEPMPTVCALNDDTILDGVRVAAADEPVLVGSQCALQAEQVSAICRTCLTITSTE